MNICQKCKTENDEESKFCNNCGSKIAINTNKIDADNKDLEMSRYVQSKNPLNHGGNLTLVENKD